MDGADETMFLRFARQALTAEDQRRLRLKRQALHAAELRLNHPIHGAPCLFQAALPTDLRELLAQQHKRTS